MSKNSIQEFARKVVKEELARLSEGHDFFLPIQTKGGKLDYIRPKKPQKMAPMPKGQKADEEQKQKMLQANITQGYIDFSNWLVKRFASRFPPEVLEVAKKNPVAVLDWINKNPNSPGMSPFQLRQMWKAMGSIAKPLDKIPTDQEEESNPDAENVQDFQAVKQLAAKVKKNLVPGEDSLEKIGDELGVTYQTAANLQNSAIGKVKGYMGYEKDEPIEPEDAKDMFTHARNFISDNQWEDYTTDAVDKYVQLLQAANGDIQAFYDALASQQIISKDEIPMLAKQESKALVHLMDLASQGNVSEAEDLVLQDLMTAIKDNKPIVLRSFQNTLARIVNPNVGKRGRPAGSKNKAKTPESGEDVEL